MVRVLYAFGLNEDGQCFSASKKEHENDLWVPTLVLFPPQVRICSVSAGSRHSLALSEDGHVYTWGWGHVGQLGHGDCVNSYQPKRVSALEKAVICVSAGGMHSACITSDNMCYTWGCNTYGQLGIGKSQQGSADEVAVPVPTLVQLVQQDSLEAGQHRYRTPKKGGFYSSFVHKHETKPVAPLLLSKISCGGCHTGAIGVDGEVYCWGKADSGQTGSATWYLGFSPGIYSPYQLPRFTIDPTDTALDISCGGFYTLILTKSHEVYGMGKEDFGCLGMLCEENAEAPKLVSSLLNQSIASISAGGWHSAFVSESGCLYTCGKGEYGRLGLGSDASSLLPTPVRQTYDLLCVGKVPLDEAVTQSSTGGAHTVFSTSSNRVFAVGRLDNGRCATKQGASAALSDRTCFAQDITHAFYQGMKVVQVVAGGAHTLVLAEYSATSAADEERVLACVGLFTDAPQ